MNRKEIDTAELLKALKDGNPRIRLKAIIALGKLRNNSAADNSIQLSDDNNKAIIEAVVDVIANVINSKAKVLTFTPSHIIEASKKIPKYIGS